MITVKIEEKENLEQIIKESSVCSVGIIDKNGLPYVFPMNFGYVDDTLYLHSGNEGIVVESLLKNPNICITFCTDMQLAYHNKEVACSYRLKASSVICRGRVVFIEDLEKKTEAMNILMKQYVSHEFKYSDPAIKNVRIWKVDIEQMTGRQFGAPNPNSRNHGRAEDK